MQDDVRFDGRAMLITGAGRGIGRSYARLLGQRGASVVVADSGVALDGSGLGEDPAADVAAEIVAAGGRAVSCTVDLSTEEGATSAVRACLEAFGRVDGVLHNAGSPPGRAALEAIETEVFDASMRINVYAAHWMTKAAWPHMTGQGYGRIVYTTSPSIFGSLGSSVPYSASKAALIGYMKSAAHAGAPSNVLVNAIAPAASTRMTAAMPASAYRDWFLSNFPPERVAPVAAFLLSEACTLHGEIIHAGGGRVSRLRLAETDGVRLTRYTIEEAKSVMPALLADAATRFPASLSDRERTFSRLLGFDGDLDGIFDPPAARSGRS